MRSRVAFVAVVASVIAACGVDDRELEHQALAWSAPTDLGAHEQDDVCTTEVDVSLIEFSVTVSRASAAAGLVRFTVHNDSAETMHEFVVVRTDLAIDALPTNEDGSFDEQGAGVTVVDEIEDIEPFASHVLTLDLPAGHYVLLCNMVEIEDCEVESHFAEGMRTDFDVL